MPSPFPGMNPYLENPEIWPEVHHLLISILAETLNPQLLPKYRVAVEKRIYETTADDSLLVGILKIFAFAILLWVQCPAPTKAFGQGIINFWRCLLQNAEFLNLRHNSPTELFVTIIHTPSANTLGEDLR